MLALEMSYSIAEKFVLTSTKFERVKVPFLINLNRVNFEESQKKFPKINTIGI